MSGTVSLEKPVGDAVAKRSTAMRALSSLPLGLMAAIVLATSAAIVWTLRRGFDWTDEAFVYTMIASNRMAGGEAWGFQHLLHPLYVLTGESVLVFRVVRLLGYVLLSVALVATARVMVRRLGVTISKSGWVFILLLAQVGTFLAWSYPPRYTGYNELGSWFSQIGVALLLLSLVYGVSPPHDQRASKVMWWVWAGLGAITTLLVFAKVTSAMVFGLMLAVAIAFPNRGLRLWKRVVSALTGATTVGFVLWLSGCPIAFYLRNARSLLFDKSVRDAFGRPLAPMISLYKDSLVLTGLNVLPAAIIFGLIVATFARRAAPLDDSTGRRPLDLLTWTLGALLLVALVALPTLSVSTGLARLQVWTYLGVLVAFIGAAAIIGLAILGAGGWSLPGSSTSRRFFIAFGACAIVAAPFIGALGTSNPVMGQLIWAASLWAVALGIALVLMTQRLAALRSNAVSLPSLIGCVVILLAAMAVKAHIATPYRTAPLLSQETSTSVPELRGLLLTETEAAWIDWVAAAGDSLGAHDVPAIAISTRLGNGFTAPGALYVFNHSGYANPWLGINWPVAYNSLRVACKKDRPSGLFVLQPGTSTARVRSTIDVTKTLATCGIRFPGDFKVVAERADKDPAFAMTIWQLKN